MPDTLHFDRYGSTQGKEKNYEIIREKDWLTTETGRATAPTLRASVSVGAKGIIMTSQITTGQLIRRIRTRLGISQRGLARKANLHYHTIHYAEANVHNPQRKTLEKIIQVFLSEHNKRKEQTDAESL